jgi:hypothetical protein
MRLILFILLFISVDAKAQMVIKAHPNYVPLGGGNLLLDQYPNAAAAYSLRKLRTAYTGAAIRVRKDTTGQPEQDIFFTAIGDLDTAALKSFLNARSGFVVKLYSQGDSSTIDFEQGTQASQPRIANLGVIDRQNGKPAMIFDGSNDFMDVPSSTNRFNYLHNGTDCFMASVQRFGNVSDPNNAYSFLDNTGNSAASIGYSFFYDDRLTVTRNNAIVILTGNNVLSNIVLDFIAPNTQTLLTQIIDANNATAANRNILYLNGGNETKNNTLTGTVSSANALNNMRLGRRSGGTQFTFLGSLQEIVIWNVNRTSDKSAIESNINAFYGIY